MVLPAILGGIASWAIPSLMSKFSGGGGDDEGGFFSGNPEKHKRSSVLGKEQLPLYKQLVDAGMNPGAGGSFGTAADYYRGLLSDDNADMDAFAAPEMRKFREQIIPDLQEQFAGMGSGALGSSGYRNASVNAGTDLAERLGAIRANLRAQGAAGLAGIGQAGLGNFTQDVMTQQAQPGFLSQIAPTLGNAAISFGSDFLKNKFSGGANNNAFGGNKVGAQSGPYGSAANYDQQFRKTGVF